LILLAGGTITERPSTLITEIRTPSGSVNSLKKSADWGMPTLRL